ncbi:MAG: IPT/TIG domain-containing protein, partial [Bacteriovorax sp.]|nr:IPT/TIG domain-containing protein [Bacteriovorax sp.]
FIAGATASFGGSLCTVLSVVNPTTITCTTAAHAAGLVNVVITNTDSQSGTGLSAYTYIPAPTVTSVSLNSGSLAGATPVTITGSGFLAGATASFGGSLCTALTVVNPTTITCATAAHAAGAVNVVVTNTDTQFGTGLSAYTYRAAPTVTGVAANAGALAGGSAVTITGTGFYTGTAVDFGGSACGSVTVVSATSITCTTAAHAAGAVTVTANNADTQTGNSPAAFTYQAAPTVTSVAPTSGFATGSTAVTITGSGFIAGATASFGGSLCTVLSVVNPTTITCTTATHAAGLVNVVITNTDSQIGTGLSAYTYIPAPTVTSVAANAGALAGGTAVTITGSGFFAGATASFGGSLCTSLSVVSSTSITCSTAAHAAGLVNVVVTNTDTQLGTGLSVYTYRAAPTVTSVSPNNGVLAGTTAVTITGTGFISGATVNFGGSACGSVTVASATSITCTTTAHAVGAVTVTATNTDTQTGNAPAAFTYQAAPTVTSVAPTSGFATGSTAVTITGSGFLAGATASFGGSLCTALTVVNPTTITCTTAAHAAGAVNVVVTNTDTQTGTGISAYTYIAAPTVTGISPSIGSIAGGTSVTITGTAFNLGATVSLGGSACTSITVVSSTSLTCVTGAHAAVVVNVVVTNTDTQTGTLLSGFTYQSMADLKWQIGATSPTPPNPDPFGTTSTNVTHTYTLKNTGDVASSTITLSKTGSDSAAWLFGTDTCTSTTLAAGATCTVQVTFLGQFLATGSYSAILNAVATSGGTTTNNMNGSVP